MSIHPRNCLRIVPKLSNWTILFWIKCSYMRKSILMSHPRPLSKLNTNLPGLWVWYDIIVNGKTCGIASGAAQTSLFVNMYVQPTSYIYVLALYTLGYGFKDRTAIVEGSYIYRTMIVQGSYQDRTEIVQGSYRGLPWIIHGSHRDRAGIVQRSYIYRTWIEYFFPPNARFTLRTLI